MTNDKTEHPTSSSLEEEIIDALGKKGTKKALDIILQSVIMHEGNSTGNIRDTYPLISILQRRLVN